MSDGTTTTYGIYPLFTVVEDFQLACRWNGDASEMYASVRVDQGAWIHQNSEAFDGAMDSDGNIILTNRAARGWFRSIYLYDTDEGEQFLEDNF
jgi:hypothetical protein